MSDLEKSSNGRTRSDALVFFGASGDLAYKKIFPAFQALATDADLEHFGGKVSDSGEGRWTVAAANDLGVPAHVLTAALFERFSSRDLDLFQNKVLSAMRFGFGGHVEKGAEKARGGK
jgi:glucose-6-phosphate 1-dehydrogenase